MKIQKVIFYLGLSFTFYNCSNGQFESLSNTVWEMNYAPECIHQLKFINDKNYQSYNCEMGDTYYGTYSISNDTILLYRIGDIDDVITDEKSESMDNELKVLFKIIRISNNEIKYFQRLESRFGEKYEVTYNDFPDDYIFHLVK